MNDEQPKLRKRSEVGRSKQASLEIAPSTSEAPETAAVPKGFAGAADAGMEDIGAFVTAVRAEGFQLTLVHAAGWGTERRNAVRKWLVTKNPATIPDYLAEKKPVEAKTLDERMADIKSERSD